MTGAIELPLVCPYCGEPISVLVDTSVETQVYIEDCEVCCQPMTLTCRVTDDGAAELDARRADD
ncbi:MAG: CPXCG motif-containing cysteine-rich protein [Gammaproteobacteria bacterium]